MRLLVATLLIFVLELHAIAQIQLQYQYDAAGNRIARVTARPQQPQNSPRMMGHSGEVTVSPTVTTDAVTISTTVDLEQTAMRYVLSNLLGSVLATADIVSQQTTVSLGQYSSGIYLLIVKTDDSVETFKIVRE